MLEKFKTCQNVAEIRNMLVSTPELKMGLDDAVQRVLYEKIGERTAGVDTVENSVADDVANNAPDSSENAENSDIAINKQAVVNGLFKTCTDKTAREIIVNQFIACGMHAMINKYLSTDKNIENPTNSRYTYICPLCGSRHLGIERE